MKTKFRNDILVYAGFILFLLAITFATGNAAKGSNVSNSVQQMTSSGIK